jgi:hypothetical protein
MTPSTREAHFGTRLRSSRSRTASAQRGIDFQARLLAATCKSDVFAWALLCARTMTHRSSLLALTFVLLAACSSSSSPGSPGSALDGGPTPGSPGDSGPADSGPKDSGMGCMGSFQSYCGRYCPFQAAGKSGCSGGQYCCYAEGVDAGTPKTCAQWGGQCVDRSDAATPCPSGARDVTFLIDPTDPCSVDPTKSCCV